MLPEALDRQRFFHSFRIATFFVIAIWLIHILNLSLDLELRRYGVLPLTVEGLKGIFFSPFIHSTSRWTHIINNSPPLFFGLLILFYFYKSVANRTLLFIYLFTGSIVWIVGKQYAFHIGASGVVYGLIGFIFFSGIFRRNIRAVILALIMILMYSGMVVGLFPDAEGRVSHESHISGAIVGAFLAFQYRNILEPDELQRFEKEEIIDTEKEHYLPSDTFDKTKDEREAEDENDGFWTSDWT
ncbi:MAG: rhomboid family intramembrane serine protease [Saprospiraceae bacterium]